jgi:hypothetical protein
VLCKELVKWTQIDPRNKISMSHFSLGYEKIEKMKKKENDVNDCIRVVEVNLNSYLINF